MTEVVSKASRQVGFFVGAQVVPISSQRYSTKRYVPPSSKLALGPGARADRFAGRRGVQPSGARSRFYERSAVIAFVRNLTDGKLSVLCISAFRGRRFWLNVGGISAGKWTIGVVRN